MHKPNYTVEDLICDVSFQHYCLGYDPQAIQTWTTWINNNPELAPLADEAKQVIFILNANQGHLPTQLHQLKDGINRFDLLKQALQQEPIAQPAPPTRSISVRFKYIAAAAAVFVLVLAGHFLFRPAATLPPQEQVATITQQPTVLSSGSEPRKTVVLPDGSVVTLRSNSSITLTHHFNTANRELTLSGEAFFDVTHQQNRPFIVHAKELKIEVLGTAFNVSAYPANAHTETALFRGKVVVTINDHPGQK
ncbi:FecR family protein [Paraflavitalea speifideaquila]|uniref:FecR family protein n=1 Tax=Paraflavitalea speifideaquila TaxID=3076558 RepID=UPI0028EBD56D|nr:FecR family protein [Paraflavitalea speifideiaquila]